MKEKIYQILHVVIFVSLFIFMFVKVNNLFEDKTSEKKYRDFYESEDEYDVMFFGSSHMMNTILPMELYREYGITSYNMANSAEAIPTTYWIIKNALDHKIPKIIVVDTFISGWGNKVMPNKEAFLHNYFDTLPMSQNKKEAIKDLLGEESFEEYFFDFSIYHSRWESLKKEDFKYEISTEKGGMALIKVDTQNYETIETTEYTDPHQMAAWYMYRISELCKEKGVQLVLFSAPSCNSIDEEKAANGWERYAVNNNISFFRLENGCIDYKVDMHDAGHLNVVGARKATKAFGKYLIENYKDIMYEKNAKVWEEDYSQYLSYIIDLMKTEKNIDNYLLLIQDEAFEFEIYLKDISLATNSIILNDIHTNKQSVKLDDKQNYNIVIKVYLKQTGELIDSKEF